MKKNITNFDGKGCPILGYDTYFSKVKPVLSGHSKIDKTKVVKTNGRLMKVKNITQCSK